MFNLGTYWHIHENIENTYASLVNFKKGIVELPLQGWKYWDGAEWNGNDDTLQFIEANTTNIAGNENSELKHQHT